MQSSVGSAVGENEMQGILATGTDGAIFGAEETLRHSSASALREAAAARVAAHRNRRAGAQAMEAARAEALRQEQNRLTRESRRGVAKVRDTVLARYEQSQSYRDFLAVEAERAVQQAKAEAEVAARSAKAIADAQMQLLEELQQDERAAWDGPAPGPMVVTSERSTAPDAREPRIEFADEGELCGDLFAEPEAPVREISTGGLTVRLYEDVPAFAGLGEFRTGTRVYEPPEPEELEELEQEIAFRRAPDFEDHILDTLSLPANLIEFPRELVAPRKARPRLAEGPLREEVALEPQLRIFEVEPEQISTEPVVTQEVVAEGPVWQGVMLDSPSARRLTREQESSASTKLVDLAPISRRIMAALVDGCCIGAAMVGFATVASYVSGPRLQALSRPMIAGAALFTFAMATLLYQLLFFWLNEATPGMRYARIGFCTFEEMNPSRKAIRRRILAQMLAVGPLGLGVIWAWMDDDRLTWHDRISRIYQRVY